MDGDIVADVTIVMPDASAVSYDLTTLANLKTHLGITTDTDNTLLADLIDKATDMIERYTNRLLMSRSLTEQYTGNGYAELFLRQYPVTAVARLAVGEATALTVKGTTSSVTQALVNVTATGVNCIEITTSTTTNTIDFATYTTLATVNTAIDALTNWSSTAVSAYSGFASTELLAQGGLNARDGRAVALLIPNRGENFNIEWDRGIVTVDSGFTGGERIWVDYTAGYTTIPEALEQACIDLASSLYQSRGKDLGVVSERIGDYSYSRASGVGAVDIPDRVKWALGPFMKYSF